MVSKNKKKDFEHTKSQLDAINHGGGPALVVAGAGTGKTFVITQRIAKLILSKKAKADQVLALTFTDKAASEMQQRVDEALPYGYLDTQIMTFHSLAERLLREFALEAGISPEFQVISSIQQTVILKEIISGMKYQYYSPRHDIFAMIEPIKQAISRLKDEGLDYKKATKELSSNKSKIEPEEHDSLVDLCKIYELYTKKCEQINALDFGDLLLELHHLLKKRSKVATEVSERYKYILVDEFQDTNSIQMEIVKQLLGKNNNIMVVGDDDQAIYRFRGASISNILEFSKLYESCKMVVLKDNFRSGQSILDAGYNLIQHNNPNRLEVLENIDKRLVAHNFPEARVGIIEYKDKYTEVDSVVSKIHQLIEDGVPNNQIAILLRKNNQMKNYIQAFQRKKIEYYAHQDVELFDQKSVKTMINLTKTLSDPLDSPSLYQLLVSDLFEGVDHFELMRASSVANRSHRLLEDVLREGEYLDWSEGPLNKIDEWRAFGKEFRAGELLYLCIKQSGYLKRIVDDASQSNEAALSVQFLTDFFKLIKQFEYVSGVDDISEFSRYIEQLKGASADVMSEISPLDSSGVQIMTVHKAKGLEFEYVFIPELVEQTFPTYRRAEAVKLAGILGDYDDDNHYQEERRLLYVALTRAKRELYMSYSLDHGGKRHKKPSRFIGEALGAGWQVSLKPQQSQTSLVDFIDEFEPVLKKVGDNKLLSKIVKDQWLYLTTNQVSDYLRSPREFWLFHILQLPKSPFHSLIYGSSIHLSLEHYYKNRMANKKVSLPEILQVFESSWQSEGFSSFEHEKYLYEKGKETIAGYVKQKDKLAIDIRSIEKPFELQLPKLKTVISGRYDMVLQTDRGIEIRDFKTSKVKDNKTADKKAKESLQLGIYALSWEKIQQSPVGQTSLEFVEDMIIGVNQNIDNGKTLDKIGQAVEGILAMNFDDIGDSSMDFGKILL